MDDFGHSQYILVNLNDCNKPIHLKFAKMSLSVISLIILSFVVSILLTKKDKKWNDWILFFWLLILSIPLTVFLQVEAVIPKSKLVFQLNEASIFLHGPFIWLYALSIIKPKTFRPKGKDLIHFLPALLVLFISFLNISQKVSYESFLTVAKILSLLSYTSYTFMIVQHYHNRLKDLTSNFKKVNLAWLDFLIKGIATLTLSSMVVLLIDGNENFENVQGNYLGNIFLCLYVIILGFWGIQQTPVFINTIIPSDKTKTDSRKTQLPKTDTSKNKYLFDKIQQFMKKERPFLNSELSLQELAIQLDIPPYLLSQILNSEANQRFFDYVNQYRIMHFKEQIDNARHYQNTLLSIAFESGFNSKSAFNRAFKKMERMTPSEYVRQQNKIGV